MKKCKLKSDLCTQGFVMDLLSLQMLDGRHETLHKPTKAQSLKYGNICPSPPMIAAVSAFEREEKG